MLAVENKSYPQTVKTLDGRAIHLAEIVGTKPVYLKFWASWCIPCQEQMPHLQHAFEKYHLKIEILAINLNINDDLNSIAKLQKKYGLTVPVVLDQGGQLARTYQLVATPYHVLIDRKGKLVHAGHEANGELDRKLQILANGAEDVLDSVALNQHSTIGRTFPDYSGLYALFFTSTWCEWYFKDSRPGMATKCVEAQQTVNRLAVNYPNVRWHGIFTRMWTTKKDLVEYKTKYQIPFEIDIDSTNELIFSYQINTFPTLIIFHNQKIIFHTSTFTDIHVLTGVLDTVIKLDSQ